MAGPSQDASTQNSDDTIASRTWPAGCVMGPIRKKSPVSSARLIRQSLFPVASGPRGIGGGKVDRVGGSTVAFNNRPSNPPAEFNKSPTSLEKLQTVVVNLPDAPPCRRMQSY